MGERRHRRASALPQLAPPADVPDAALSALRIPSRNHKIGAAGAVLIVVLCVSAAPRTTGAVLHWALHGLFWAAIVWRVIVLASGVRAVEGPTASGRDVPGYTVVAALYREAAVATQLVRALETIDYPRDRLEVLFILEPDDPETAKALRAAKPPRWMRIVVAPEGEPKTKPRALNVALAHASGEFLVVYDAEDAPHPMQLREAAARFRAEDHKLVCLQAPLRIRGSGASFYERQFAAEYAALFETTLPAMTALGLPFPLGGTSNHFRTAALRAIGGWDACNVTEDADLGFRIARYGWRTGMLGRATTESAPPGWHDWLPQRTRWLKGYMQTLLVHLPAARSLGPRGVFALWATLGLAIASAAVQGAVLALELSQLLLALFAWRWPSYDLLDLLLLGAGWTVAGLTCAVGSQRSGRSYALSDALAAPVYWAQSSLALAHALWQLFTRPTHWDKTDHRPDTALEETVAAANAGRLAA